MQDMRKQICEKALRLFLDQGYDNTALSQVARDCGITKAGLYHYFKSKEALLYAVHMDHIEENFKPILDSIENIGDPLERMKAFFYFYINLMTQSPHARLLVQEVKRLDEEHQDDIRKTWQRAYEIIRETIQELQSSGKFKNINASFSAFSAVGMTTWIFHWFDYSRKDSTQELVNTFWEIFLHGMSRAPA